ncbi:MAG: DNA-directed RNA polymerase subunit D [Nanoarchaeota archaeon]|nr:DNA-directed RNA polymerase subunit D [Nanoarchaeota archaeon]
MKKIEQTDNQIVFTAEMDKTIANAIRRYINHVPTLAVDEVEISKNDSALYDETVAHRIGLVPLKMEKAGAKKKMELKMDVKREGSVYSGDLVGNPKVVYDNMPLTILSAGQEIQLSATVTSGTGAEHAKFSPGMMYYRNVSEISLDKDLSQEIAKLNLSNEIQTKGNKIVLIDDKKREVLDVCEGVAKKNGKPAEVETTGNIVLTLESFGQMPVGDIFVNSIGALKKDLDNFSKTIGKA